MKVRPAAVGDAEAISDIHIRSWQAAYKGVLADDFLDELSNTFDRRVSYWSGVIESPPDGSVLLVAEDEVGKIVGFISCGKPEGEEGEEGYPDAVGELSAIYLDPDVYRSGYGTALWDKARTQLETLGYDTVILWVMEQNPPARAFYEKHGWELDGGYMTECMGLPAAAVRYRISFPSP